MDTNLEPSNVGTTSFKIEIFDVDDAETLDFFVKRTIRGFESKRIARQWLRENFYHDECPIYEITEENK